MPIIDDIRERVVKVFPQKSTSLKAQGVEFSDGSRPFEDDMIVPKPVIVAHTFQAFFSFLAMATFASVASFQAKFKVGPSGLSGFAIFISVADFLLSLFLLLIPVIYEKYDKFNRLARALKEDRVSFILVGAGFSTMLLISFVTTISAWTEPGCKDASKDPNASLGDAFKNGLPGWCNTKKAGAVFFWLATAAWLGTVVLTFLAWREGKSNRLRDPPFTHPIDPSGYAPSIATRDGDEEEDDGVHGAYAPASAAAPHLPPIRSSANPTSPFDDENRYLPPSFPQASTGRQSMDTYGAFSDPAPTGFASSAAQSPSVSRTMQYADPYAAVKASLTSGTDPREGVSGPPSYEYAGYR